MSKQMIEIEVPDGMEIGSVWRKFMDKRTGEIHDCQKYAEQCSFNKVDVIFLDRMRIKKNV